MFITSFVAEGSILYLPITKKTSQSITEYFRHIGTFYNFIERCNWNF